MGAGRAEAPPRFGAGLDAPRLGVARAPEGREAWGRLLARGVKRAAGVRLVAWLRPLERGVTVERVAPRCGVERAEGRAGVDARFCVRLGAERAWGALDRDPAERSLGPRDGCVTFERAPEPGVAFTPRRVLVAARVLRASPPLTLSVRRTPVAADPEPAEVRARVAPGRLIGPPRVVRSAATGLRPTVGTRVARPVASEVGAVARALPLRAAVFVPGARVDEPVTAAPTLGVLRFTEATLPRSADAEPRPPAVAAGRGEDATEVRGWAAAGCGAGRGWARRPLAVVLRRLGFSLKRAFPA